MYHTTIDPMTINDLNQSGDLSANQDKGVNVYQRDKYPLLV